MVELVLISADEPFSRQVQHRLRGRARLYVAGREEPWQTGRALVEQHPGALVLLDLDLRDEHGRHPLAGGEPAADWLPSSREAPLKRLLACGSDLGGLPRELLEWLVRGHVRYLEKARVVPELRKLARAGRAARPRARARRRDEQWCLEDAGVRRQYAGQVVAVHGRKVWGSGTDASAACAAARAQPGCPPLSDFVLVLVPADDQAFIPFLRTPADATAPAAEPEPARPDPPVPHSHA
jgi:hypothetical protein